MLPVVDSIRNGFHYSPEPQQVESEDRRLLAVNRERRDLAKSPDEQRGASFEGPEGCVLCQSVRGARRVTVADNDVADVFHVLRVVNVVRLARAHRPEIGPEAVGEEGKRRYVFSGNAGGIAPIALSISRHNYSLPFRPRQIHPTKKPAPEFSRQQDSQCSASHPLVRIANILRVVMPYNLLWGQRLSD